MSEHHNTEIENIGNSPIKAIFVELAQLDEALRDPSISMDYDDYGAIERHWALREAINATPACSLAELHAKARPLQVKISRDENFTNHGPGPARHLAKSLVADLLPSISA
jgi:hypothetical protein